MQLVMSLTQVLLHSSSFLIFDETNVGGGSGNVQLSVGKMVMF